MRNTHSAKTLGAAAVAADEAAGRLGPERQADGQDQTTGEHPRRAWSHCDDRDGDHEGRSVTVAGRSLTLRYTIETEPIRIW